MCSQNGSIHLYNICYSINWNTPLYNMFGVNGSMYFHMYGMRNTKGNLTIKQTPQPASLTCYSISAGRQTLFRNSEPSLIRPVGVIKISVDIRSFITSL
jgi:hypothetical protein